jgi:hypothetical protein
MVEGRDEHLVTTICSELAQVVTKALG